MIWWFEEVKRTATSEKQNLKKKGFRIIYLKQVFVRSGKHS